ncbi:hypothetical protein D9M69_702890 [compost metagenome]
MAFPEMLTQLWLALKVSPSANAWLPSAVCSGMPPAFSSPANLTKKLPDSFATTTSGWASEAPTRLKLSLDTVLLVWSTVNPSIGASNLTV